MSKTPSGLRIGEPDFVFDSQKRQIPRRIVRLENGQVVEVVAEYIKERVIGSVIHADLQRFATEQPGETFAIEWLSNRGWVRFVTCCKPRPTV
jgi:hypothetical protein